MGRRERAPRVEAPPLLQLPGPVSRLGRRLLDQQLWCWGRDVAHPDGNLLVRFGMERQPRPAGADGTSGYWWTEPGTTHTVALWGFGVATGDGDGGAFLARGEFYVRSIAALSSVRNVWSPLQMLGLPRVPASQAAVCLERLAWVFRWTAAYERWIERELGAYRSSVVRQWKRPLPEGEALPTAWERLAEQVGLGSPAPRQPLAPSAVLA